MLEGKLRPDTEKQLERSSCVPLEWKNKLFPSQAKMDGAYPTLSPQTGSGQAAEFDCSKKVLEAGNENGRRLIIKLLDL